MDCKRIGIIPGDGEGHGLPGALQMLPLFTTFRAVMENSTSTKYVLEKMHEVAQGLNVSGTAIYFVIDFGQSPGPVLCATSAGHPPLIILDEQARNRDFPSDEQYEIGMSSLGLPLSVPLGEARTKFGPGDIVVATPTVWMMLESVDWTVRQHRQDLGAMALFKP